MLKVLTFVNWPEENISNNNSANSSDDRYYFFKYWPCDVQVKVIPIKKYSLEIILGWYLLASRVNFNHQFCSYGILY